MIIDILSKTKDLTIQERAVASYIKENPKDILNVSIHDLAILTYTSAGTILRLCKKMGFKGYSDFKYQFASEYQALLYQESQNNYDLFSEETSLDELIDRMPLSFFRSVEQTMTTLEKQQMIRIVKKINEADEIIIDGTSLSYKIADFLAYKFTDVGYFARAFSGVSWSHLTAIKENNKKALAIIVSFSGENKLMLNDTKILKDLGIPYILVSSNIDSSMVKDADEFIRIFFSQVDYLSSSRFGTVVQALFDNLIAINIHFNKLYFKQHHKNVEQTFELTESMKLPKPDKD